MVRLTAVLLGVMCCVITGQAFLIPFEPFFPVPVTAAGVNAVPRWERIIEENKGAPPSDLDAHLLLAVAYANTGKPGPASMEFDLISKSDYTAFRDRVVAENEAKLKVNPGDILALNLLAFAYYSFGQYEASLGCFKRLRELDPRNVWICHYLALVYGQLNRDDEAFSVLCEALRLDSRNEYTHLLLGLAYQKRGQELQALWEFIQAPNALREVLTYKNAFEKRK